MSEFTLREYTKEEYKADMQKLLEEKGLHDAVEKYCDKVNSITSILGYIHHRDVQECLCDILYLIELDKGDCK